MLFIGSARHQSGNDLGFVGSDEGVQFRRDRLDRRDPQATVGEDCGSEAGPAQWLEDRVRPSVPATVRTVVPTFIN